MSFSAEQFLDLVERAKGDQGFETVEGHRRARRVPCIGMVEMQPVTPGAIGPKMSVRLRDISAKGLAVLDKWTAAKDAQFIVSLPRDTGRPLRILCAVRYSARLPGNLFRTGAQILGILPDAKDVKPGEAKPAAAQRPAAVPAPQLSAGVDPAAEAERIRRSILG